MLAWIFKKKDSKPNHDLRIIMEEIKKNKYYLEYKKYSKYKFIDDDLNIGLLNLKEYFDGSDNPIFMAYYNKINFNTEKEYDEAYKIALTFEEKEKERVKAEEKLKADREKWKDKYRKKVSE